MNEDVMTDATDELAEPTGKKGRKGMLIGMLLAIAGAIDAVLAAAATGDDNILIRKVHTTTSQYLSE